MKACENDIIQAYHLPTSELKSTQLMKNAGEIT